LICVIATFACIADVQTDSKLTAKINGVFSEASMAKVGHSNQTRLCLNCLCLVKIQKLAISKSNMCLFLSVYILLILDSQDRYRSLLTTIQKLNVLSRSLGVRSRPLDPGTIGKNTSLLPIQLPTFLSVYIFDTGNAAATIT